MHSRNVPFTADQLALHTEAKDLSRLISVNLGWSFDCNPGVPNALCKRVVAKLKEVYSGKEIPRHIQLALLDWAAVCDPLWAITNGFYLQMFPLPFQPYNDLDCLLTYR